jgi:NAD(P)-dependent dehydrogenase (short-subunit alcohol dehydrogenase family)
MMAPNNSAKQQRSVGSILLVLSVLLVAATAIFLKQPQPRWDWDTDFLPLARELMVTNHDNADHEILKGLTVMVTGATSGIGKALTLLLTSKGATVIATGRSKFKLEQLLSEVLTSAGESRSRTNPELLLVPVIMEMSNLQSVSDAADEIKSMFPSIDILVCNAGMNYFKGFNFLSADFWSYLSSTDSLQTAFGHDLAFTVNYLSHFLLTDKLLPQLLSNTADGQVVDDDTNNKAVGINKRLPMVLHMTSSYHWGSDGRELESLTLDGTSTKMPPLAAQPRGGSWWWRGPRAYTNSKLAQILHGRALQQQQGDKLRNVFVCPAWVATSIGGDHGSWAHTSLSLLAYPLGDSGWGLQSTLRALFDDRQGIIDGEDFYINSYLSKLPYHMPLQSAFPAWFAETGLRDTWAQVFTTMLLTFQRFYPASISTRSSVESYNMTLAMNLYDWSKDEVKAFL